MIFVRPSQIVSHFYGKHGLKPPYEADIREWLYAVEVRRHTVWVRDSQARWV